MSLAIKSTEQEQQLMYKMLQKEFHSIDPLDTETPKTIIRLAKRFGLFDLEAELISDLNI
jgi:hypothetical protein